MKNFHQLLFGCWFAFLFQLSMPSPAQDCTFVNPVWKGADPWVFQKDQTYYFCKSMDNGIAIAKSNTLTDPGEWTKIWDAPSDSWNSANIWAPEIHYIQGKWFIYYTAGKTPGGPFIHQRSGVLRATSSDPFGSYEDMGMLHTGDDLDDSTDVKWAIDLTPLEHQGKLYAIWSGWKENRDTDRTEQQLYIAEMENPYTISSERVNISSPEEDWETGGELDLQEGPQILKHKGNVFIIYSTRESWRHFYRLGQLTLSEQNADPLAPENWIKKGPVFEGTEEVHGVGHCSFAKSPDGTEDWILYHSKTSTEPGWDRDVRLQPFGWDENGQPVFGSPVAAGVPLPCPKN